MEYYAFPALLCAGYNSVHEYGVAAPVQGENAINFTGDFVPLMPLGSEAEVRWVLGEKTIAVFAGSVYLSTASMMQLVGVPAEQMDKLRALFAMNTQLPAAIQPGTRRSPLRAKPLPVEVVYLSPGLVKLQSVQPVEEGASLLLSTEVDFLTLRNLELKVQRRVLLRKGENLLLCTVSGGGEDNYIALSAYTAKLSASGKMAAASRVAANAAM